MLGKAVNSASDGSIIPQKNFSASTPERTAESKEGEGKTNLRTSKIFEGSDGAPPLLAPVDKGRCNGKTLNDGIVAEWLTRQT